MTDIRLQRMAKVLVHYSHEAIEAGAYPETFVELPGVREIMLKHGSDQQLAYIPPAQRMVFEKYEEMLSILAQENTKALSGVDPTRMALVQQARRDLMHTYMQRTANGSLRWSIAMFPTALGASIPE